MSSRRKKRRRQFRVLIVLFTLPVLLELGSYAAGRVLQSKWGMYVDPLKQSPKRLAKDYDDYLAIRDPNLGWPCAKEFGSGYYEADGSIKVPFNATVPADDWWVSLYGDSYTFGLYNTEAEDAWANQLAKLGKRRVKNYGLGGYGSDQAHLRYVLNEGDTAEVVVLGHMTEDMTRNLTRMLDFKGGDGVQTFAFKPRYVLDDAGQLELVPIPSLSEEDYLRALGVRSPQLILEHESLHPGGPCGTTRLTFPFTISLLKNLGYWRLRSRVGGYPEYRPFYDEDHPLQGYAITRAILESFHTRALARGQRPLIVLFPDPMHLRHQKATGEDMTHPLAEDLRGRGVDVLEFAQPLLDYLGERDPDSIYKNYHYLPEVDPLIAETIYARITAEQKPR